MKKIIGLIVVLGSLVLVSCTESNAAAKVNKENLASAKKRDLDIHKGAPIASVDKKEYNFGTVTDGDIVKTTFVITNTGKSPLVITDAKTTCGCTVPSWPKDKAIAPGESTEIKVEFNTAGKGGGRQIKDVTLFTNTANGREIVTLKGIVNKK
ncbi:hypothetical protein GCM10011416_22610 [Polaribacter pacificus]|uniref:DUF1573 domain-containing protein n=1 Tax=Polaribacter pacificus TaxID=1775173 RepID=A0A917MFK7_9FLAO|nr:DUF1573 domain-containing protein [Polaribacter pacificus]GGH03187.1 hypothetical protein GCM10011416_22610 [Polaribacter pacificus]